MSWIPFVVSLVMNILVWIFKSATPRVLDGAGPGELEDRLQEDLEDQGW